MSETRNAYQNRIKRPGEDVRASVPTKRLFAGSAVVVIALLLAGTAHAQQPGDKWLGDEERGRLERLRDAGNEALHNLDYVKARAEFSELARLFPQHPAGPQHLAGALLFETLYNSRRGQAWLYDTKSFSPTGEDRKDPELANRFWSLTREAHRLAMARLKQYPKDTEALYYLGNVTALSAIFEGAVERRHGAALDDLCEAADMHRRVVKRDPAYVDAELTNGLYNYVIGSRSLPVKVLLGFMDYYGSKKRGLAAIERVAKEGKAARDQAGTLLVIIYMREKRYGEAAALARQLAAKYPRNHLYRLRAADALLAQAAAAGKAKNALVDPDVAGEAFAIYEALLSDREVADTAGRLKGVIHFKYGEALLKTGRTERAAEEFLAAAKAAGAGEELATVAHLNAARALGASNKRAEATAQYRLVLSRPDVYDAHDEARKSLDNLAGGKRTR